MLVSRRRKQPTRPARPSTRCSLTFQEAAMKVASRSLTEIVQ